MFIDENRDEFGIEPICATLQVAPSTYYAFKSRVPSARQLRDAVMMPVLLALWTTNFKVYGVRKLWKAALRAGHVIGRDQTARLMRGLGTPALVSAAQEKLAKPTLELMAQIFDLLEIELHRSEDGHRFEGTGSIPIPEDGDNPFGEVGEGGPQGLYANLTGLEFHLEVAV